MKVSIQLYGSLKDTEEKIELVKGKLNIFVTNRLNVFNELIINFCGNLPYVILPVLLILLHLYHFLTETLSLGVAYNITFRCWLRHSFCHFGHISIVSEHLNTCVN